MLRDYPIGPHGGAESEFFASPNSAAADYNADDLTVVVTGLPARGVVLRADGLTPLRGGEIVTAAELVALKFAPAPTDGHTLSCWSGLVVCAPQSRRRLPIAVDSGILAGASSDRQMIIVELPTNGTVCLADGMTTVAVGQSITAAQLSGLTFNPAENATGTISVFGYADPDRAIVEDVLLVIGPDSPSQAFKAADAGARDSAVASVAVALLLDLGVAASDQAMASAATDPNGAATAKAAGGTEALLNQNGEEGAAAPAPDPNFVTPPFSVPEQSQATASGSTPSGAADAAADTPPTGGLGSSTPPNLLSGGLTTSASGSSATQSVAASPMLSTLTAIGPVFETASLVSVGPGNGSGSVSATVQSAPVTTQQAGNAPGGAATFTVAGVNPESPVAAQFASPSLQTSVYGAVSPVAPSMTVTTDHEDYAAGSVATFTVAGVHAGGSVTFRIADLASQPGVNGVADVYAPFTVTDGGAGDADGLANGVVVAQWQVPVNGSATGAALQLTATSDGRSASTTFTDAPNAITLENQKAGTPQSIWQIDAGTDSTTIQGFTTAISTNVGGTVQFKISNKTGTSNYHIDIYRLGYYGGDGARLVTTVQHQSGTVVQPAPLTQASTGLVDAGNWSVTDSWAVPTDAVSGVYIANVIDGTQVFQIPFVVRNDASTSAIVFQTSDETWQAYNPWGGANLYAGNGPGVSGSAYAVSYNRPITTRDGGLSATSNDMVFSAEYPAIYWLEQNGYDVSYISGMDAATNGALLLNHKVYMDVGHDEYWTDSQYNNVLAARQAGVSLMFLSGNEVYWQTRFAPSINATADANRTLISYKDTHANGLIDPTGTATATFMDARFASTGGLSGTPSNALTGTVFSVDSDRYDTITIPYGQTLLRVWRNTSVANTQPGGTASLAQGLLGYEWDSSPNDSFRPAGLVDVSSTTLQVQTLLLDYGNKTGAGTATHNLVQFRDPVSGAMIFSAGTVFWSWGLATDHDQGAIGGTPPVDPSVQQAMVNLFADMGVQPTTLQASLMIASQSADHTAPTSTITNLSAASVVEGQSMTVTGTAHDVGGVIGGVEVSTDGGTTWHAAASNVGAATESWSYTFKAGAPGTIQLKSRAVDDSLNLETPSAGVSYKVTPSSNLTIFSSTDTPAVVSNADASSVELGVKFVSSTSGQITGIRFYKGSTNTGTHLGDLWTSSGVLLASATFANETASGWQQVNFATPVQIQAGQTYIASYHTNVGHYSSTDFYFDNAGHTNGSLTATGNGLNGVYAYGTGPLFPNNVSFANSDNFWVDVVFNDTSLSPQANNDSGFAVTGNGSISIAASTLLANDVDPMGLAFSLTSVSNPVNGAVSYNAQTQTVTFTPTTGYAGPASFTYTITDSSGATGSGQVAMNVNYPTSAQSLFGTSATPSIANSGDTSAVEVGVKFSASVSGVVTGIRFYKGSANIGTHIADLWSSSGALLATATFTNESASGWQQVSFSSPVAITAGATYTASYHTNGNYSDTPNYFTTSVTSGQLTAPAAGNGVYAYSSGSIMPTNSYQSGNYWVDVIFDGSARPVAQADSGFIVNENGSISIAASTLLANDSDSGGLAISITGVSNALHGAVAYNSSTQTVTFTPTAGYSGSASFSYTVGDSGGGTASASVSLFVNDPTAETLFGLSKTPSVVTVNETASVELGVKFTADANGLISGLRFYKGAANTGTHVADLWSSSGTLLATATFANESASGWQQVNFSSPVAITAGVTYVASYHTSGNYSVDSNYFANPVVSGDLTAPAGANGVYGYGAGSVFPNGSYNSSNYWVDVVYSPTAQSPVAHNDSGFFVGENSSIAIAASTLLANDTDPNGLPLSLAGVSNPVNGTVSYNAQTQTVTFTPNVGYTGPASFSYSVTDNHSAPSSANVSLTVSFPPPVANNDSGFIVNENGSITIAASTLLANDTDPNGLPLIFTGVSNALNGAVSYDSNAKTVTFTPTNGYTGVASFNYSITDSNGGVATANVGLFANNPTTESLFSLTSAPANASVNDPSSVELGVKFTATVNGTISGLRFYKGAQNIGTHVADLWSSTGTLLATATFGAETSSGWQQVNFASPVAVTAGVTYVASYHTSGNYSADGGYFNTSLVSGDLTAPAAANGVYAYGTGSLFPTNTYNATNYWVDVVYNKSLQPPVATNDSGFVVAENSSVTIAASSLLANDTDPNGLPLSIAGVSNASNGSVSYNASNQTITFTPTTGYAGTASFTYSVANSGGATASASASLMVNDPTTTSLFNPATAPSIASVNDPSAIELGVKFQSSADGQITGLRFYKGPSNTGTHVADLWSSTGTLLASATFSNETASGWQQVNFATPVAITAGATYVASYHTNAGDYAADPNLFAAALTNGPLTALSSSTSGGNGVYAYGGSSLFPTNSFNSTSYGVDVVFKAQLAA